MYQYRHFVCSSTPYLPEVVVDEPLLLVVPFAWSEVAPCVNEVDVPEVPVEVELAMVRVETELVGLSLFALMVKDDDLAISLVVSVGTYNRTK